MADRLGCVDLFAGAGGFSLGFSQAGFNILVATDYHRTAEKTYTQNLEAEFLRTDAAELANDVEPLLQQSSISTDEIDIVIGGPPCKGFSTAGVYNPDDPRNTLFHYYIQIVEQLKPRAIVLENVPGAKSIAGGKYISDLRKNTRSLGYNTQMLELNAANYGVPQLRRRLFFIGFLEEYSVSYPPRTHTNDIGQQRLGSNTIEREYISTKEAIGDLDFLPPGQEAEQYRDKPQSEYQAMMRANQGKILYNHIAPDHNSDVRERFEHMEEGKTMSDLPPRLQTNKQTVMKLNSNRPAKTITTLPEDFVHYNQPRIPTVRELARLQSFPDWFEFTGPRTTGGKRRMEALPQYSQVGNAVPPIMAEAIGRHLKALMTGGDPEEEARSRLERLEM